MDLKIIVGLGNPGSQYARTRHNVGFDVVELLAEKENIPLKKLKCHALIGEGTVGDTRCVLVQPQTFMNLSGQAVAELISWYKCVPADRQRKSQLRWNSLMGCLQLRTYPPLLRQRERLTKTPTHSL